MGGRGSTKRDQIHGMSICRDHIRLSAVGSRGVITRKQAVEKGGTC
jgi:hypothetical protein